MIIYIYEINCTKIQYNYWQIGTDRYGSLYWDNSTTISEIKKNDSNKFLDSRETDSMRPGLRLILPQSIFPPQHDLLLLMVARVVRWDG